MRIVNNAQTSENQYDKINDFSDKNPSHKIYIKFSSEQKILKLKVVQAKENLLL